MSREIGGSYNAEFDRLTLQKYDWLPYIRPKNMSNAKLKSPSEVGVKQTLSAKIFHFLPIICK